MKNITKIPADLEFVNERKIKNIKKDFLTVYAQDIVPTITQATLLSLPYRTAEAISREETFSQYGIQEKNLFSIYEKLETKATDMGVNIEYADLTVFREDDYYENDTSEDEKHSETARSDGKNLLLEKDLAKAGGIQGRMYDLLHLAFGHMVQWSTDNSKMLLTKEEAWAIGYRNHEGSPDVVLDMMSLYEFEAGMQAIEILQRVLEESDISANQKEKIVQYFVDYVYCDRDYIIQHYRGNHESFQKFWKFAQPIPRRCEFPEVNEFIERSTVEIGLIRDKQK